MSLYTVRTPDGELHFDSLYDVEKAWRSGLISHDDEIAEAGKPGWTKAGSMKVLQHASKADASTQSAGKLQSFWIVLVVILSVAALVLMAQSRLLVGGGLAVAAAIVLLQVTTQGWLKKKR